MQKGRTTERGVRVPGAVGHCEQQHTETSQWRLTESSLETREDGVKDRRPNAAQPAKVGVGIEPGQTGESLLTTDTNCLSDETVGVVDWEVCPLCCSAS